MPDVSPLEFMLSIAYPSLTDPNNSLFLPRVILKEGKDPYPLKGVSWDLDFPVVSNSTPAPGSDSQPAKLTITDLQIAGNANVKPDPPEVTGADQETVNTTFHLGVYAANTVPGLLGQLSITGKYAHSLVVVGQTFTITGRFTASIGTGTLQTSARIVPKNDDPNNPQLCATVNSMTFSVPDEQLAQVRLSLSVDGNFKDDIKQKIQSRMYDVLNADSSKRTGIQNLNKAFNEQDGKSMFADMLTDAINQAIYQFLHPS